MKLPERKRQDPFHLHATRVNVAVMPTGAPPSTVHAHSFVIYTLPDGSQLATI
jgi:hypothetical protein